MATLPIFESTFTFKPQPLDSSGILFTALSQSLTKVETASKKEAKENAKRTLQANQFMLGADIINHSQDILQNSQQQPDKELALAEYKNSYQSYANSVLENTPEKSKLYAQRVLFNLGQKGAQKIEQQLAQQGKVVALTQFKQTHNSFLAQLTNDASLPNFNRHKDALAWKGQLIGLLNNAVSNDVISPQAASNYFIADQKEFEKARILGIGKAERAKGPDAFLKYKQRILTDKGFNKIFKPSEKDALILRLDKDAQDDRIRFGISKQQVETLKNDILFQLSKGETVDPASFALVQAGDQAGFEEFQNKALLAQLNGAQVELNKYAPVSQVISKIAQLQLPFSREELQEPGIAQKAQYRLQLANQLTKNLKEFTTNPATFTENDQTFKEEDRKLQNSILTAPEGTKESEAQFEQYLKLSDNLKLDFQRQRGLREDQLHLIDGKSAQNLAERINSQSSDEVFETLKNMGERYGNNMDIVMRDLRNAGVPVATNLIWGLTRNQKSGALAAPIIQAFQTGRKKMLDLVGVSSSSLSDEVSKALTPYADTLYTTNGNIFPFLEETKKQVELATLGLMQAKNIDVRMAASMAADALINNHYQYISFAPGFIKRGLQGANRGYNSFRIPADADKSTYMKALNSLYINITEDPPENLRIPNYIKQENPFLNEEEQRRLYIEFNVKNGGFINSISDTGLVFVDNNSVPIQTTDRQTFGFEHDSFNNPDSPSYKEIIRLENKAHQLSKKRAKNFVKELERGSALGFILDPLREISEESDKSLQELEIEVRE